MPTNFNSNKCLRTILSLITALSFFYFPSYSFAEDGTNGACTKIKTTVTAVKEWRASNRLTPPTNDLVTSIAFKSDGDGINEVILSFFREATDGPVCGKGKLRISFDYGQLPIILALWGQAVEQQNVSFFCSYNIEPNPTGRCNITGQ